jgi:putative hydrolase of the HAD superfamily
VPETRALFWDVGGVLLTNAWDHDERKVGLDHFNLDKDEFEARHKEVVDAFEQGRVTIDEYLGRTVFYQSRSFSPQEFQHFMFELSRAKPASLEIARSLAGKYVMGTINNESRELNEYRIANFRLGEIFNLFVSSCFVGLRKPDERIYHLALDLTQRKPEECCFIDDRPANIEGAISVGMKGILFKDAEQLKNELRLQRVEI